MQKQPSNFGPVERKPAGKNWLPYALGGAVALALVCALGFVIFAILYKPATPQMVDPTPTLNIVTFVTAAPGEAVGTPTEQPPVEETPQVEPEATTEAPSAVEEPVTAEPAQEQPQPAETQISQAVPKDPYYMSSPDYSIHAFLFWRAEVADRDLGLIKDAGFRWVKQEFAWREIEGAEKGVFNWDNTDRMMGQIAERNLKVIARLGVQPAWAGGGYPEVGPPDNYQDFADFAFAVADRYKGQIGAYQIWNEPNLSREWGNRPPSPAEYTELLKVTYEAIKRADPNAIVITAGLAPTTRYDDVAMPDIYFVQGIYDAGAASYFDMLGVHGAGYKAPPEMDPGEVARDPNYANPGDFDAGVSEELRRIYCFRHVEDVHNVMVKNGDVNKRVIILEFGWTTDNRENSPYKWHHVSEEVQGDYIVRAYKYAEQNWKPWIAAMSVIYMPDADWTAEDEQWYWSIVVPRWPDAWPRPAYHMIKAMSK